MAALCDPGDPVHLEDVRRYATDLLCDHLARLGADQHELDDLPDEERERYIAHLSDSLAPHLQRFIGSWMLNEFPTVEDWRDTERV